MTALAMDTRKVVKRLRDAGFTDAQAETVTDVLVEVRDHDDARLATKTDLDFLRQAVKADLESQERRLETKIEAVKTDLMKWLVPMLFGQAALIAAIVKLL